MSHGVYKVKLKGRMNITYISRGSFDPTRTRASKPLHSVDQWNVLLLFRNHMFGFFLLLVDGFKNKSIITFVLKYRFTKSECI